ncbi:MAG: DUF1573 domain-containing protein [Thermoanaerobaculia bacterium]
MSKHFGTVALAGLLLSSIAGLAAGQQTPPAVTPSSPTAKAAATAAPPGAPGTATASTTPAGQAKAASAPAAPAPKLVPVEAIQDVGKVAKGEKVKVDFAIRNDGPVELVLTDVHPTCGCTVASFDAKIAPGAVGKIHAEIDTVDFAGPIAKTITVLSNDPAQPRVTLTIKARVEPQVNASPGYARFVFVQNQASTTVKQWLWAENFPDFKVLAVRSPYKFIEATFRPATAEERRPEIPTPNQWIVETAIQPDAEVGALRDFLVVETNHPKQKELRLAVTGFVRPLLSVTPAVAEFGTLGLTATSQDLSLVLVNFGEAAIEIRSVSASVPGVEAKIKPIEEGRRWEVKLTLTGKMPKGRTDATVTIETSSPQQPTLKVPLRGTVS